LIIKGEELYFGRGEGGRKGEEGGSLCVRVCYFNLVFFFNFLRMGKEERVGGGNVSV